MTASEKLTQLIENDKLTDEQQDNLNDWGVIIVPDLKDYLIGIIKSPQLKTDSIEYKATVSALYNLLDYADGDYIVYDESGVHELDFDVLNDALGID